MRKKREDCELNKSVIHCSVGILTMDRLSDSCGSEREAFASRYKLATTVLKVREISGAFDAIYNSTQRNRKDRRRETLYRPTGITSIRTIKQFHLPRVCCYKQRVTRSKVTEAEKLYTRPQNGSLHFSKKQFYSAPIFKLFSNFNETLLQVLQSHMTSQSVVQFRWVFFRFF